MQKIKVAVLIHGLGPNGIDTLFANLASQWNQEKYEITYFMAVDQDNKQFWEDKVLASGVRIIHLTDLDGTKLLKWPVVLYFALKEYGPFDTIHVNMDMLNGINLLVAKKAGIPNRICHAHVSSNNPAPAGIEQLLKKGYLGIMRRMIQRYSSQRIACSDLAGSYFFGKENYAVINNGIELRKFYNRCEKRDENILRIITIGRMTPPKNPFFLLNVVNEIYKLCEDMQFYWVGSGELEKEIKEKVTTLDARNHIHFLGVRNDVENVLAECDYFLLPSLYEGLGVVLIEAQAAGLVCFASEEVPQLADCGLCNFISLKKNEKEWANEIVNYKKRNIKRCIEREKLAEFDICNMARALETYYAMERV